MRTPTPTLTAALRSAPARSARTAAALALAAVLAAALGLAPAAAAQDLPLAKLERLDPAAGDLFACAVDVAPSSGVLTAVAGSVLDDDRGADSGSAYVFELGPDGWRRTAKLVPSGVAAGDQAGFAVALDGDRIVLGAPRADAAGQDSGAAWIFRRERAGWVEQGRVAPSGLSAFDQLGRSVAAGGGRIALGAPGDDEHGPAAGAVWVLGAGGAPVKLADVDSRGSAMGWSVAVDATRVAAGAPFDDTNGLLAGAVWIFDTATGLTTKLLPTGPGAAGSQFGTSVALSGDLLAVGARRDGAAGAGAGSVRVFRRTEGGWSEEAKLVPAGLAPGDELGISVAFDGNVLYAGARFDDGVAPDAGTIHRFERRGGTWVKTGELSDPASGAGDELGFAVAAAGGAVLTGRYRSDVGGADAGEACVFGPRQEDPDDPEDPEDPEEPGEPRPTAPSFAITKTADVGSVAPGGTVTYTIVARNRGTAGGLATVDDDFPAPLACTWTCAATAGTLCTAAGAGDLSDPVTLPVGGTATYTATCAVPASTPPGPLVNTAAITGLGGASTSSTTAVAVVPAPPLFAVAKSATPATVFPGGTITYTVAVTNSGTGPGTAAVSDPFPAGLACTWTCAATGGGACAAAGAGAISDTATLPPGAAATYTATCTVPASTPAPTTVVNTATITGSDGSSSSSTATTTVVAPPPELGVTKTAAPASVVPGDVLTYTITVANTGPGAGTGTVSDPFPAPLACTWTCTASIGASCAPAGPGPILDTATLPPGASAVYTATCTVPLATPAPSSLVNTVTLTGPDGATTTATATTPVVPGTFEPTVTKTASPAAVEPGDVLSYEIVVTNGGTGSGTATVGDVFPPDLACVWQCVGTGGAGCTTFGSGPIADPVALPPGSSVVYSVGCAVSGQAAAPAILVNTVVVTGDDAETLAEDTTATPIEPSDHPELVVTKTANPLVVVVEDVLEYEIVIDNQGLQDQVFTVDDDFPDGLECTWTCTVEVPDERVSSTAGGQGAVRAAAPLILGCGAGQGSIENLPVLIPTGSQAIIQAECVCGESPETFQVNTVVVGFADGQLSASAVTRCHRALPIPALSPALLAALGLLLAAAGARRLRRRAAARGAPPPLDMM